MCSVKYKIDFKSKKFCKALYGTQDKKSNRFDLLHLFLYAMSQPEYGLIISVFV